MVTIKEESTLKRLGDNFIALAALQGINYLVPLIVFPYLVRVLGIDGFGLYSFVYYVLLMGAAITDYGFDLTATKLVSIHREDPKKLDEIFSAVITIKLLLSGMVFMGLLLLILFVEKFSSQAFLYFIGFGLVLGQALFPVWFFQGIERMRYITILNALAKTIFTLLILFFVKGYEDIDWVLLFNSLGALVAGVVAFWIAQRRFGVRFYKVSKEVLWFYLVDGWYVFVSRIAVQLYTTFNIVLLGFFVNDTILGYFSIVEKFIRALGSILQPLTSAVYPYLSKLYNESKALFFSRNIQLSLVIVSMMIPLAFLVNYFGEEILHLISGKEPTALMIELLFILSFILVVYLYGAQFTNMLVILGETKLLNQIVIVASVLNLLLGPIVLYFFDVKAFAWLSVFNAFFIASVKGYYVYGKFRTKLLS